MENNLLDFCFDAVDSKDISLQDNRGFVQNHLKLNVSESPKGVNIEYVVHRVYKFEAEYQAAKVRVVELMYDVLQNLNTPATVEKFSQQINRIILRRPELDLHRFEVMSDNLAELCNNRMSQTDINHRSLLKEVQNHVLTIFDSYKQGIEYFVQYKKLLGSIKQYQHEIFKQCMLSKDLKHISLAFTNKIEEFLKLDDNMDLMASLDD